MRKNPKSANTNLQRYEELLESTRDAEGIEHRDKAIAALARELSGDTARATDAADVFDELQSPQVNENGELILGSASRLILSETERIRADRAMAEHTQRYLECGPANF
jgi:hypothetical protein